MKDNERAQAMVEFVLILPIIVLLLLGMIDIGRMLVEKSNLDNKVNDIVTIYDKENKNVSFIREELTTKNTKVKISKNEETSHLTIEVEKELSLLSPFLNDYQIKVKRVIVDE